MEAEEAYQKSIELTEDTIVTYRSWLMGNRYCGNISISEMPKYADADYLVYYDYNFDHYVEVKIRFHRYRYYVYEKIPFRKFAFAYTMKAVYDRNTFYLIRWFDNKIGLLDLTSTPDKVDEMVARHDRGEDSDLYALYHINHFKMLNIT